jgi:hypothetical protein
MDSMSDSPIWRHVTARLAGLDHITRREVLLRLLRDGTFLALLAAEAAEASGAAGAQTRRGISPQALTAPAPDATFAAFRTELTEGTRAAVDQAMRQARAGGAGVVFVPSGPTTAAACGGAFSCGSNSCSKQNCGGTNTCDTQSCPTLDCQGKNTCERQTCDKLRSALTAGGFLNKYANTQFVVELRQMFGADVERQVDQMLRAKTTLRQRGLIEPRAPRPVKPAPAQDLLRRAPAEPAPPGTKPAPPGTKPVPGVDQPPLRRSP